MHYIQPVDRTQFTFLQSLDDLVAPTHYVRLLDTLVDSVIEANPEAFTYKGQSHIGRRAYSPGTMLKLYLYGYLNGIKSSRRLERESHRNIEVIWLLGNLSPDHKSIADYRKDKGDSIKFITTEFRRFLKANGYIKGKLIAIDGTKVKASANRDMLTPEKIELRLKGLDKKIEDYLQLLMANDDHEDRFDDDFSGSGNEELLEKVAALSRKVEELEKSKQLLEKQSRSNLSPSDSDAQLMKSRDGMIPAYNVQTAVDEAHGMIAHSEVFTTPTDISLLEPMLTSLAEEMQIIPDAAVTDCGYEDMDQIQEIEDRQPTKCYVALKKQKKNSKISFSFDNKKNEYRCSQGKRLPLKQKNKLKRGKLCNVYQGIECEGCPLRSDCTTSKYGRIIHRYHNHDWPRTISPAHGRSYCQANDANTKANCRMSLWND